MAATKADLGAGSRDSAMRSLFETIVELSDDAIVTCDKTGRIAAWGASATRLFGYDAEQAIGTQLDLLVAEHLRPAVVDLMGFVNTGERVRHFETEILRPDGMSVPVALSLSRIVAANGDFLGSVAIARDLTEQFVAQAAMAEVEAWIEDGEALAHVGSWVWDIRTGAVQGSSEFYRIGGVDPLEFSGTLEAFLDLIDPDDRSTLEATMIEAGHSGSAFESRLRLADPAHRALLEVRARPMFDSSGATIGLRGIGKRIALSDEEGVCF